MSSIKLTNVNKYYYSSGQLVHAVQNLNMNIADGEFVSIVGPSGCGKSSTMRMIAGLEGITSGTLEFDGRLMNGLPPAERNVALSFESYALYQHMTVRDNISFCLKSKRLKPEDINDKANWIIDLLDIGKIADQRPIGLSGGQQQLVSLARALVRNPSVTLLDEPISHLDLRARQEVSMKIREIHNMLGLTMIYVTHNQEEAFALADRIAVMDYGKLLQIGRREEILEDPHNMFVAEFVGEPSMNFIPCTVERVDGIIHLHSKDNSKTSFPFNGDPVLLERNGIEEITVGIRPISLKFAERDSADALHLSGELFLYELLGENAIIKFHCGSLSIAADIDPDVHLMLGSTVRMTVSPNKLHYFDTKSGKSLRHLLD